MDAAADYGLGGSILIDQAGLRSMIQEEFQVAIVQCLSPDYQNPALVQLLFLVCFQKRIPHSKMAGSELYQIGAVKCQNVDSSRRRRHEQATTIQQRRIDAGDCEIET